MSVARASTTIIATITRWRTMASSGAMPDSVWAASTSMTPPLRRVRR